MERLDHFMARANAAYYATRDPYRDFTTSPEISQVFGEILGLWSAVVWEQIGRPDPVLLVEAGPGRGTLMADALRVIGGVARDFRAALRLHLIEAAPRLRAMQAERFPEAVWHDWCDTLPDGPMLLLANEFLDALPIRQFVGRHGRWMERFVDDGQFREVPAASPPALVRREDGDEGEDGEPLVLETSPATVALARLLGTRLCARPGAALFFDYGPARGGLGDSLQALRDGRPADPLRNPGSADLTAHVNFTAFSDSARDSGAVTYGPVAQGLFLARLGLFQRTDRLARTQPPARASALIEAARRLAEPDRMGRLFKVLALCSPGFPTPPGFEA